MDDFSLLISMPFYYIFLFLTRSIDNGYILSHIIIQNAAIQRDSLY